MISSRTLRIFAVLFIAFAATPAWCTVISTFSDYASWSANTSSIMPVSFGTGNFVNYVTTQTSSAGVTFAGMTNGGAATMHDMSNTYQSWYNFDQGFSAEYLVLSAFNGPSEIDANFTTGVTSFGTYLMTGNPYGLTINVATDAGPLTSVTPPTGTYPPVPSKVFIGATFTTPITKVTFIIPSPPNGSLEMLSNFSFGVATQQQQESGDAPEAATMILIGSGLLALRWMRRRRAY